MANEKKRLPAPPGAGARRGWWIATGLVAAGIAGVLLVRPEPEPVAAPDPAEVRTASGDADGTAIPGRRNAPADAPREQEPAAPPPPSAAPEAAAPAALQPAEAGRRLVLRGRSDADAQAPPPFEGGQGKEAVQRAISAIMPLLVDCYEQGLKIQPELAGRLMLEFKVEARDGEGRILDAEVDEQNTTLDAVLVQACALDALSHATFPQPRDHGAVVVRHPFEFGPR